MSEMHRGNICVLCHNARSREYYRLNIEKTKEVQAEYRDINRHKLRKYYKNYYAENRDARLSQSSQYQKTEAGKTSLSQSRKRRKPLRQEKLKAKELVYSAIRNNTLVRRPCEVCGDPKSEGHHKDYSKPLDVEWLCRKHHLIAHGKLKHLKKEENDEYANKH